jgi:uncharacterized cupin superfamily protein
MPATIHWDEVHSDDEDLGVIAGRWTALSDPAGSVRLGCNRIQVPPGRAATPQHAEDEELFFVLAGSGRSHQEDGSFAIRAGDTVYYGAWRPAHTVVAGDEGLDVIAFGTMGAHGAATRFPRLGVVKVMGLLLTGDDRHQWDVENDLGPIELPAEPDPRPPTILNLDEVEPVVFERAGIHARSRFLGRRLGARGITVNHTVLEPGSESAPLHCHSGVEELFVVLDGDGVLLLGREETEHPVRAGSVVARPAGTGVPHGFRAGEAGLTLLAFSDIDSNDACFYPRSGKVAMRGLGIVFRPELVPYLDE